MESTKKSSSGPKIKPRIIIHGGAGNITHSNLTPTAYEAYRNALLDILTAASVLLDKRCSALQVATYAVTLLEDEPLFNAGKGAVFTRAGTTELEASIMVSNGYQKRGVGCMMLKHVKNPIKLASEMLIRGNELNGGGAQGHCQLAGLEAERLAKEWGLDIVPTDYFFTQRRWDEHLKGLEDGAGNGTNGMRKTMDSATPIASAPELAADTDTDPNANWNGKDYLPQGTVGCVVLDMYGTTCVATSTGGLTNKLPGRIGDTPTLGAGFWAEEWLTEPRSPENHPPKSPQMLYAPSTAETLVEKQSCSDGVSAIFSRCLSPGPEKPIAEKIAEKGRRSPEYPPGPNNHVDPSSVTTPTHHVVAMSGTGNGDSFLRLSAVRTCAAIARFSPNVSLGDAVSRMAGPGGELQKSAGERWKVTGEGEGGIIGIECVDRKGTVVWDFNCGGMFRAWVDDKGEKRFAVFREEGY